jgi:ribonuclease BN (tRNA processing enzyme)
VLLLDAGTGVRRLVTEPELLEGVERVSVVLTHFHLDHVFGLAGANALPGCEVWAPARLHGATAEELIERLLGAPFLAPASERGVERFLDGVHELDGEVEIGPFRIEMRVQPKHSSPTVAVKVNRVLAYCTDTASDEETIAFAAGSRFLLHEAFWAADATDDPFHSASGEAARIAAAAEVERLVLVHVNPRLADDAELLRFARPHFVGTEVGRDGLAWVV